MFEKEVICVDCGSKGTPVLRTKGNILIELVSWLCFLLPGIFYSIWRHTIRENVCRCCGGNTLVPPDSPQGKNYPRDKVDLSRKLTAIYPQEPSARNSGHCRITEGAKLTSDFPQSIKIPPAGFPAISTLHKRLLLMAIPLPHRNDCDKSFHTTILIFHCRTIR